MYLESSFIRVRALPGHHELKHASFVSVAISGDGSTLAVMAPGEDSAARGIGGNQNDESATAGGGAVYLY